MLTAKEKRDLWLKDANAHRDVLEGRAASDIEKHRKGYAKIRFVDEVGAPVAGKKVKLTQTICVSFFYASTFSASCAFLRSAFFLRDL